MRSHQSPPWMEAEGDAGGPCLLTTPDPLSRCFVKVNICDILGLDSFSGLSDAFNFLGRPITKVTLMGFVVGTQVRTDATAFLVDDGTGVVLCVEWGAGGRSYELGQCVEVRGRLATYRNRREVIVTNIRCVENPNDEPLHWMDCLVLRRSVYSRPP